MCVPSHPLKEGGGVADEMHFAVFQYRSGYIHHLLPSPLIPLTIVTASRPILTFQHECTHLRMSAEEEHSPSDVYSMAG